MLFLAPAALLHTRGWACRCAWSQEQARWRAGCRRRCKPALPPALSPPPRPGQILAAAPGDVRMVPRPGDAAGMFQAVYKDGNANYAGPFSIIDQHINVGRGGGEGGMQRTWGSRGRRGR